MRKRNPKNHAEQRPALPARRALPRRWVVLALLVVVMAAATWLVLEFIVWNRLPGELVGRWAVVQGPPEYSEAIFEFHRSGRMFGHVNDRGNVAIIQADVRVEGDQLYSTTKHPRTGAERVTVQTIRSLTAQKLVVADEAGRELVLARVN